MGNKINPNGLRVGIIRDWEAKWYAGKDYAAYLKEDLQIRKYIEKRLANASVSTVEIERAANRVNVSIHTAKPGMVIGKGGSEVENLRKELNDLTGKRVHINIIEIKKPDLDAKLVGENIARQLEGRVAFVVQCVKQCNELCVQVPKVLRLRLLVVLTVLIWLVLNHTQMELFLCIL